MRLRGYKHGMGRMWTTLWRLVGVVWILALPACGSIEATVECPGEGYPAGDPFIRSQADFDAWMRAREEDRGEAAVPESESCALDSLRGLDWDTQAVAVVYQGGLSELDRMTIRGDRLVVETAEIAQCGGQQLLGWMGTTFVVVPATVRELDSRHRPAAPCPNHDGPAPP